jgi:hypothetical protein
VGVENRQVSNVQLSPFDKHHTTLHVKPHLSLDRTTNTSASDPGTSWYYQVGWNRLSHELPSLWFHRDC